MKKYNDIIFHSGNCLNNKKPFSRGCSRCIENCPHNAINKKKEINLQKCTECGVCTAVCPSDGFTYKDMKSFQRYLFNSQEIIVNCPAAQPLGYEIPCLGMLDNDAWTTLLLLTEEKPVKIFTGDCSNCQDKLAGLAVKSILAEINQQWPNHPTVHIEDLPAEEDSAEPLNSNPIKMADNRSRGSLREQGRDQLKMLFPAIQAEETYDIPVTRQWLKGILEQNSEKKVPYYALVADDKCTSCGVCSKICPQNALHQVNEENRHRLVYEPLKCVQCGRCAETCVPKALYFNFFNFDYKYLTGKILLIEPQVTYCKQCGKQLLYRNEDSLCPACASIGTVPKQMMQAEAGNSKNVISKGDAL